MTDVSLIGIITAVIASTGFWQLLINIIQNRNTNKTAQSKMLLGLAHDRICYLGEIYIKRGCITKDEYENLVVYLFEPYKKLGGNGTAEKIVTEVNKLPIKG